MSAPGIIGNSTLYLGDCLEVMARLQDGSIDAVICDPPYGNMDTDGGRRLGINGWDVALQPADFLAQCNRLMRPNGALILFSQEPYTSRLIQEAHGSIPFSYRMAWIKDSFANPLGQRRRRFPTSRTCAFSLRRSILSSATRSSRGLTASWRRLA